MADKVAFTAVAEQGGHVGPKSGDTTLVFNSNITNIGGGYDETSGYFRAPFQGLYYFTFSYRGGSGERTGLQLIKGSELIVQSFDDSANSTFPSDNTGHSAFLQLQAGEKVYVRLPAGRRVWAADRSTSFSGFLVSRG